ncbi:MAG: UxaA family hydrolase [Candidatus Eremiobacteraeota bacterium]|nr:UxaA family hydrolase [Candidatus Eremiobacteraeota bacterium]
MALSKDGAVLRLSPRDNIAVALKPLDVAAPIEVDDVSVSASQAIPIGHKVALLEIRQGDLVLKYGQTMGRATVAIAPGEHVHVHNVEGLRGRGDLAAGKATA